MLTAYDPIAVRKILEGRMRFKQKFLAFKADDDNYRTVFFCIHRKSASWNETTVFAINPENFDSAMMRLDFTVVHKHYHLYQCGKASSPQGESYSGNWTENMARYTQLSVFHESGTDSHIPSFYVIRIDEIVANFEVLTSDGQKIFSPLIRRSNKRILGQKTTRSASLQVQGTTSTTVPSCHRSNRERLSKQGRSATQRQFNFQSFSSF